MMSQIAIPTPDIILIWKLQFFYIESNHLSFVHLIFELDSQPPDIVFFNTQKNILIKSIQNTYMY